MSIAQELQYKEIDLVQGSDAWKLYRRTHLMASDTPKIMNISKWGNSLDCYLSKIEGKEVSINEAMLRGMALEPVARDFLSEKYKIELKPKVFESTILPFMGASLDAINDDLSIAYEIKCPSFKVVHEAMNGIVSPDYIYQCQKQMFVRNLKEIGLFYFFDNSFNHLIKLERDNKIIESIKETESEFWYNNILTLNPPSRTFRNVTNEDDVEANKLAEEWAKLDKLEKSTKKAKEEIESKINELYGNDNVYFERANVKYISIERNGNIDWFKLCDKYNIPKQETEIFRKPKTVYSKLTYLE